MTDLQNPEYVRQTQVAVTGVLGKASLYDREGMALDENDQEGCIIDEKQQWSYLEAETVLAEQWF